MHGSMALVALYSNHQRHNNAKHAFLLFGALFGIYVRNKTNSEHERGSFTVPSPSVYCTCELFHSGSNVLKSTRGPKITIDSP